MTKVGILLLMLGAIGFSVVATGRPAGADTSLLTTRKATFYVIAQGDKDLLSLVTVNVADELNKHFTRSFGTDGSNAAPNPNSPVSGDIWAIPQPGWDQSDLMKQCADPSAIGGLMVISYSGYATHFWLLWQTETTTFDVFAEVISCNHPPSPGAAPAPQIVSIIAHLPGAGNSPWVVRRTQTSIPLLTVAAIGTGLSKNVSANSKASNLTLAAIAGTVLGGAGSKDVPGYSDPVRLRLVSQHVGVDVVDSLGWLCGHTDAEGGIKDATPGRELCSALRFAN